MQLDDENTIRRYSQQKQKYKELRRLPLELILLLAWERYDPNQLSLQCGEVGAYHTYWYAVCLAKGLVEVHFLFHVHLDDGCALKDIGALVKLDGLSGEVFGGEVGFLYDGDGLAG